MREPWTTYRPALQGANPQHWQYRADQWWYSGFPETDQWTPMRYSDGEWREHGRAVRLPSISPPRTDRPDAPWHRYAPGSEGSKPQHWREHDGSWWYGSAAVGQWTPYGWHGNEWLPAGPARRLPEFPVHGGVERDSPWADHPAGSVGASPAAWVLADGIWHFDINAGTGSDVQHWAPYHLHRGEWVPIRPHAVTPPPGMSVSDVMGG